MTPYLPEPLTLNERRPNWTNLAILVALSALSIAAPVRGQGLGAAAEPPPFQSLRYNEDYRFLLDPARRTGTWNHFKYIRLAADANFHLSLGGEVRGRAELVRNPDFDLDGTLSRNDYLLGRSLLHADLHLAPNLRLSRPIWFRRAAPSA